MRRSPWLVFTFSLARRVAAAMEGAMDDQGASAASKPTYSHRKTCLIWTALVPLPNHAGDTPAVTGRFSGFEVPATTQRPPRAAPDIQSASDRAYKMLRVASLRLARAAAASAAAFATASALRASAEEAEKKEKPKPCLQMTLIPDSAV